MLQQNLLRIKLSTFGGLPLLWVQIIIEFQDIGHSKNFLNNQQKLHYLHQNVIGEARRAVQVYSNDWRGYIFSIKRFKCVFGQQSNVAQVYLSNVTMGKQIANDDDKGPLN